jgi:hypothetical protein
MIEKSMWRKSSYSGNGNNDCVEVALTAVDVKVRDTKDRMAGHLTLSPAGFQELVRALRNEQPFT